MANSYKISKKKEKDYRMINCFNIAQSAGAVEYTHCTPTGVLDMTQNNKMVKFKKSWCFGECGVLIHCLHSHVHSGPEL